MDYHSSAKGTSYPRIRRIHDRRDDWTGFYCQSISSSLSNGRNLVRKLRVLGFEGPYRGGKHPFMIKDALVLTLPNPHRQKIGPDLLAKILRHAGISHDEWVRTG
ncbi:MAG TPA: type II toxin-antitoxin system HicA family toxin [Methanolinea sp.]|nr:type II toxin-antitoxin system HicA family toxin [Methanolinea sp.]HNQ30740.1 type II toxin-antitoxin system HicA family toxin [Methanolinea sp.]